MELKVYLIIFGSFQITSEERTGPVTYLEVDTNGKDAASAVGVNKTTPNVEDLDYDNTNASKEVLVIPLASSRTEADQPANLLEANSAMETDEYQNPVVLEGTAL